MRKRDRKTLKFSYATLRHKAAYSLVEVIFVMALFTVLSAAVGSFYITSQRAIFKTVAKSNTAGDIRSFMQLLDHDARSASAIILHDGFYGDFRKPKKNKDASYYRLTNGQSGNLIIMLYYGEDDRPDDKVLAPIESVVAYWLDEEIVYKDYVPIYRIELSVSEGDAYKLPEQLLPIKITEAKELSEMAKGLAEQRLFYQFRDNCIVISSTLRSGNDVLSSNNIHNFTITSR